MHLCSVCVRLSESYKDHSDWVMATLKVLNFITFPKDCLPNIVMFWPQLRLYNLFHFFSVNYFFYSVIKVSFNSHYHGNGLSAIPFDITFRINPR